MNETAIIFIIFGVVILMFIGAFILFSLPMLGIFGGLGLFIKQRGKQTAAKNTESLSWPSTPGKILKSRVQVSGGEYTTVAPYIEYQYQVGAVEYTCSRIRAGDHFSGSYSSHESYDLVDQFPVDKEVDVYYNPRNPKEAAIVR